MITKYLKVKGLGIDLAWLAVDEVIGDSISTKMKNFVSVDCSNAIGLATSNIFYDGEYITDVNEDLEMVLEGTKKSQSAKRFMLADIYSKKWCELKYLSYLEDDSLFMDKDFFLYKTDKSGNNVKNNVQKTSDLYEKYQ